jgi:hypothetical protein
MKAVINAVEALVGRRPNTIKEVRAELMAFLKINNAEDLIVDDDIEMLLELCSIYSEIPIEQLINKNISKELNKEELYKRVGPRMIPLQRETDKRLLKKVAEVIVDIHADLHYEFKQHGIVFIDQVNVVFSFEQIRSIEGMPNEFSGAVVFPRIKNLEDRNSLIPQSYLEDKKWTFKTLRNKYSRLEARYLTTTELMDLLTNREIITHGNYR